MRFLHIAKRLPHPKLFSVVFEKTLAELGQLTILSDGHRMPPPQIATEIRKCDVLLTGWGHVAVPPSVAETPGNLKYICHMTGEMRAYLPPEIIERGIPVTNWGDAIAFSVAEGAVALLFAVMKDIPRQVDLVRKGGWILDERSHGESLKNLNVGIYGLGLIGLEFVRLIQPFGPVIRIFDPFAKELPAGTTRVSDLAALFRDSQAVAIHAAQTDQTRKSVDAEMLALLPDHGILINTARGGIVDQQALFAELKRGRLRAGLDVLEEPDELPGDHWARHLDNCIFSAHCISRGWPDDGLPPTAINGIQQVCLGNLRRFVNGEPLKFVMDKNRYLRST